MNLTSVLFSSALMLSVNYLAQSTIQDFNTTMTRVQLKMMSRLIQLHSISGNPIAVIDNQSLKIFIKYNIDGPAHSKYFDAWGNPYSIKHSKTIDYLASSGQDRILNTSDDITVPLQENKNKLKNNIFHLK